MSSTPFISKAGARARAERLFSPRPPAATPKVAEDEKVEVQVQVVRLPNGNRRPILSLKKIEPDLDE